MDFRIGFLFFIILQNVGALQTRLLMIIKAGSFQTVGQLWYSSGDYNDAAGTRQSLSLENAIKLGDYRSSYIDQWATDGPETFTIGGYNERGQPMWYMKFNYPDISKATYIESGPVNIPSVDINIEWGTTTMGMESVDDSSLKWFYHFQNSTGAVTLLSNTGAAEPLTKAPTNPFSYSGCFHYSSVFNDVHVGTDTNWMTWELCAGMCQNRQATHMMIQMGNECLCGNLSPYASKLSNSQCIYICPGDSNQRCGGSTGIYTVYSASDPVPTYNRNQVTSRDYSVGGFTIPHITKILADQLADGVQLIYLSSITVSLDNGSLKYNVYFSADENVCFKAQSTADLMPYSENGAIVNFTTSSLKNRIATTAFQCIWIDFPDQPTVQSTSGVTSFTSLMVFEQPADLLLTAPYFVILGHYDDTTTPSQETTVITTTTQPVTTTTGQETTTMTTTIQPVTTTTGQETTTMTTTTGQETTTMTTTTQPVTTTTGQETTTTTQPVTTTTGQETTTMTTTTQPVTTTSTQETTTLTTSQSVTTASTVQSTTTTSSSQSETSSSVPSSSGLTSGQATLFERISTTPSNVSPRNCLCRCSVYAPQAKYQNMTTEELEEALKEEILQLKRALTIPKGNLSATIRKKTSARDSRPSAKSVGALGITLLCFTLGFLIFLDCLSFGGKIISFVTKYKLS